MCPEIPGIENVGSTVENGHQVYRYHLAAAKEVKIGYNGNLNTSAQVRITNLDVVMDMSKTPLFTDAAGQGRVFPNITIVNLKNYGDSTMAMISFQITLTNAKLVQTVANATYGRDRGIEVNEPGFFDAGRSGYENSRVISALGLSFVAQQYEFCYTPVNAQGTAQGNIAGGFNVSTNQLI
jgi:hypothetical protein